MSYKNDPYPEGAGCAVWFVIMVLFWAVVLIVFSLL